MKIQPITYKQFLEWLLEVDDFSDMDRIEELRNYPSYEEYIEDNEVENENFTKLFYKYISDGTIKIEEIEDTEDTITTDISGYKRMLTCGLGYNNVRIVLLKF